MSKLSHAELKDECRTALAGFMQNIFVALHDRSSYGPQVPDEQVEAAEAILRKEIDRIHKMWGWKHEDS